MKIPSATLFMTAASIAVIAVIAASLSQVDSPSQARMHKLDAQRLSALQRINNSVRQYWKEHNHLPEQLDQLSLLKKDMKDAVSGQPYEYKASDATSYQLCAVFDTVSDDEEQSAPFNTYGDCSIARWEHGKGRVCFSLSVKGCK